MDLINEIPEELLMNILRESFVTPRKFDPLLLLVCKKWQLVLMYMHRARLIDEFNTKLNSLDSAKELESFQEKFEWVCLDEVQDMMKYSRLNYLLAMSAIRNRGIALRRINMQKRLAGAVTLTSFNESERAILKYIADRLTIHREDGLYLDISVYSLASGSTYIYRRDDSISLYIGLTEAKLKLGGVYVEAEPENYRKILQCMNVEHIHHLVLARFIELL